MVEYGPVVMVEFGTIIVMVEYGPVIGANNKY